VPAAAAFVDIDALTTPPSALDPLGGITSKEVASSSSGRPFGGVTDKEEKQD